ncbi:MAG: geranylgeranyl reductase family protein [bacterium]|jgi:geranylgeranyl reductase family protein
MHQVIIVGAGPAGAYLAYRLAREGIDVLLLEKERFPRSKPCAGGISPKVVRLLEFNLEPVIEDRITEVIFTHRLANPVRVAGGKPIIYTVRRACFDAYLLEQAKLAGARVRVGVRVTGVQSVSGGVIVRAGDEEWPGLVVAGADGACGIVARSLHLTGTGEFAVTLEKEIALSDAAMHCYRGVARADYGLAPYGYAWLFPKQSTVSIGAGTMLRAYRGLSCCLNSVAGAAGLADAAPVVGRGWIIPYRRGVNILHRGRGLVLGDAAGCADALTGEGIYHALLSAVMAAEVIAGQIRRARPDLADYTRLVREKIGPEMAAAYQTARWFHPVSGLLHRLFRWRPELIGDYARVLAGEMSYAQYAAAQRRRIWRF